MPGHLFADYFLTEGIRDTPEWKASLADPDRFAAFRDGVLQRYETLSASADPNEATTEQDLIRPVLELLGWDDYLPQQGATRNEDIPDHLLFPDAGSKARAAAKPNPEARYPDAIVVEESKRFGLALDARDADGRGRSRTPHGQILRYLSTAEVESESRIRWGILTNGVVWRLYDYRARPRASGYFETNLAEALKPGNEDDLRLLHLLLRRSSFTPQRGATASFLETALAEGRRHEQQVAEDISGVVFERVFPTLVRALAAGTDADLPAVREAALIFLYRLLFVLYAEDRGLLPVNDSRYEDYGLRKPVREHVARRMDAGAVFSYTATSYYDHLATLCKLIDQGDASDRAAAVQRRPLRPEGGAAAGARQAAGRGRRLHRLRPEPRRDRLRPPLHQLPRHVRPAARVDLRAPAGARARPGRPRHDSRAPPTATPARTAAASTRRRSSST